MIKSLIYNINTLFNIIVNLICFLEYENHIELEALGLKKTT